MAFSATSFQRAIGSNRAIALTLADMRTKVEAVRADVAGGLESREARRLGR